MLNSSQTRDGDGGGQNFATGELRAFVAIRLGGHSWVIDLLPNYELSVGRGAGADVRIDVAEVADRQATLQWNGAQVKLAALTGSNVLLNGRVVAGAELVEPGDEIKVGPAIVQVNITLAPS